MTKDPIIAEIHTVRRDLWRKSGGNSQKFSEYLRKRQTKRNMATVSLDEWKRRRLAGRRKAASPRP